MSGGPFGYGRPLRRCLMFVTRQSNLWVSFRIRRRTIVESKQTMQRREFVSRMAAGGTAGLVAAGPLQALASAGRPGDPQMLRLTVDEFAPLVGDQFELEGGAAGRVSAKLVEAVPVPAEGRRPSQLPRREAFSLVFQTDGREDLTQGVHTVRHPALGTLALLVVPIAPRAGKQRLEAVFN